MATPKEDGVQRPPRRMGCGDSPRRRVAVNPGGWGAVNPHEDGVQGPPMHTLTGHRPPQMGTDRKYISQKPRGSQAPPLA